MGGLRRLEYRGYDSAGVAILDDDGVIETAQARRQARRCSPTTSRRRPLHRGGTGIGHTRWATHGGPTDRNAHPHLGDDGRLALIHNGIIENFAELKDELLAEGYVFDERDRHRGGRRAARPRVPPRRRPHRGVPRHRRRASTAPSPCSSMHRDQPGVVVGARRNSPLVIGLGDGENFLGSDVAAFVEYTKRAVAIGQDQIVTITADARRRSPTSPATPSRSSRSTSPGTPPPPRRAAGRRFMRKEVSRAARGGREHPARSRASTGGVHDPRARRRSATRSSAASVASPSSRAAPPPTPAWSAKYAIEQWARVPVEVELSHEFRYREPGARRRHARRLDQPVGRDHGHAHGREVRPRDGRAHDLDLQHAGRDDPARVRRRASTRTPAPRSPSRRRRRSSRRSRRSTSSACTSRACAARSSEGELAAQLAELQAVPEKLADRARARPSASSSSRTGWPTPARCSSSAATSAIPIALEGALKLKELAYIHAEGFAAGELKHGPIALIEPGQPVFVVVPSPRGSANLHPKVVSNIQEIRARGARVIAIAEAGDAAVLPFADEVLRIPLAAPALRAAARGGAAAGLRDGARAGEGPRRRPAAQPRQVRDGGVTQGAGGAVIVGIGIDVVDIARFERVDRAHPGARRAVVRRERTRSPRCARSPPDSPPRRRSSRRSADTRSSAGTRCRSCRTREGNPDFELSGGLAEHVRDARHRPRAPLDEPRRRHRERVRGARVRPELE